MEWLKSKTTIVAACFLALVGFEGYWMMSTRDAPAGITAVPDNAS